MKKVLKSCFAYHKTEMGEMCEALKVMRCVKDGKICPFYRRRSEVEAERRKEDDM